MVGLLALPQLFAAPSPFSAGGATATLNPVQVSIQTKNITTIGSYDLVAYNSTGAPVASFTGQFPRVTFELPSGTYLLAATASGSNPSQLPGCCVCAQSGVVSSPPAQTKNSSAGAAIILPCYYSSPPMEYGYSLTQVSGSANLTIATLPPSAIPTTNVSVSVSFKNGTAVSGAYVSANVVGADWYAGDNSAITMSNQTGTNGVAELVVPEVPLTIDASQSVQVSLPQNQTTVQVEVGGQPVNVTAYFSPYVYLTASALLVPPQTSLSMVVIAQPESRLVPYGVASSSGASANAVGAPSSSQAPAIQGGVGGLSGGSSTTASMANIPPIPSSAHASPAPSLPSSSASSLGLWEIGTLALAGVAAAAVGVAISKRR